MSKTLVTRERILSHVKNLGENHPPVPLHSVDRTIKRPALVRERFADVLDYMARVEMEVDRNVLELLVLLPGVDETNRLFYQDVWQPQEHHHGLILDQLQTDLGLPAATPNLTEISPKVRVMGLLSHLGPVQDVIKLLYYLTGAATEKSAMLAYTQMNKDLKSMGEDAIVNTIISPIKVQEPGHFAFYRMSADELLQSGKLAPWQLHLARIVRSKSFGLVGAGNKEQRGEYGGVLVNLGLDLDLEKSLRDIARVETEMLWAHKKGLKVPSYVWRAFQESIDLYKARQVA